MKDVKIGTSFEINEKVTKENLAVTIKSGDLQVLATPMMIAMMENAASNCVKEFLEKEETTVGTLINVSHVAATPLGMKVTTRAEVISVNGREITFKVESFDEKGKIGEGEHKRFVVLSEKFQQKTDSKNFI